MKKSLTIFLLLLSFTLSTNAQSAGQYVRRKPSQQNTQKSTQKNTPKSTQKTTQKSTPKATQQPVKQNQPSKRQDFQPQQTNLCRDGNHPHMIDLGLPSGTKWACCNVGAAKPAGYGSYYAWGETKEKSTYSWQNYTHCNGSEKTCRNIGKDIARTQYDVAHVKWGGSWRMPSRDQIVELYENCTKESFTLNGVNGYKFTSKKNGKSIFFPDAGIRTNEHEELFAYWASTFESDLGEAYQLFLDFSIDEEFDMEGNPIRVGPTLEYGICYKRYSGLPVRPVSR